MIAPVAHRWGTRTARRYRRLPVASPAAHADVAVLRGQLANRARAGGPAGARAGGCVQARAWAWAAREHTTHIDAQERRMTKETHQDELRTSLADSLAEARAASETARRTYLEARNGGRPSTETRPLRLAWDQARAHVSSVEQLLLAYSPSGPDRDPERSVGDTRAGKVGAA